MHVDKCSNIKNGACVVSPVGLSYMPTFQNWLPGHMTTPTNLVTTPTNIVITPISYTTITLYTVHNTGSSQPEEKRLAARSTASATGISAC